MNKKKMIIVGATGNVGRIVTESIIHKNLNQNYHLKLLASPHSHGKRLNIAEKDFTIEVASNEAFQDSHICIFNTENEISAAYVPIALKMGSFVLDSSSYFRLQDNIPLIVPPVNSHLISPNTKQYSLSNCLASPISIVASPLHRQFGIKRINAVTYQSTSGAGKNPMDECWQETKSLIEQSTFKRSCFERQIAFNVIPQIGAMRDDGSTSEEYKIIHELRKILGSDILITSTAVRVPVMVGHSIALNLELCQDFELEQILSLLEISPNVKISDNHFSTPVEIVGSNDVFVGRIRRDLSVKNGLHLWLCSDNLRRGAATDTIELLSALLSFLNNNPK